MMATEREDLERAIQLVTTMMREYPGYYAARGRAFRVEFFTDKSTGQMLACTEPAEPFGFDE